MQNHYWYRCLLTGIFFIACFIAHDVLAQSSDLDRGSGSRLRGCAGVTFAPGISPGDLEVTYVPHNSIKITIKGTEDSMVCAGFYAPAARNAAHVSTFRFTDGTIWKFDDIDKRAQLRARAVPIPPIQERSSKRTHLKPLVIPVVADGSWKLHSVVDGKATQQEYCGDPLSQVSRMASEAVGLADFGCSVITAPPDPRKFKIEVDCPADRFSEDGSSGVLKGRSEISINAPSPQSFTYLVIKKIGARRVDVQGTRVGNC